MPGFLFTDVENRRREESDSQLAPELGLEPRPADLDQGWCWAPSISNKGTHASLPVRHSPAEMYPGAGWLLDVR